MPGVDKGCTTHHKACDCREEKFRQLREALQYAVEKYGQPGGPWNVPSDPGGWFLRAKKALK